MATINSLFDSPDQLREQLADKLIFNFPPRAVELATELDGALPVPADWVAVVRLFVREWLDLDGDEAPLDPDEVTVQYWNVEVGHDEAGAPIGARLVRGVLEVTHPGFVTTCPQYSEGERVTYLDEDGEHIHYRRPAVEESVAIDPAALIAATVRARHEAGFGHRDEPAPERAVARWQETVADLLARRRRVPPNDLLPPLAAGTIRVGWGPAAAWLRRPGVLVAPKISVRCRESEAGGGYEVDMRFSGHLEETGCEACCIADDLAYALSDHYCRSFDVRVRDEITGIRGASGELP